MNGRVKSVCEQRRLMPDPLIVHLLTPLTTRTSPETSAMAFQLLLSKVQSAYGLPITCMVQVGTVTAQR